MNAPALYATVNSLHRRDARDFSGEFSREIGKMSGRCIDIGSGPGDTVIDFILPKMNKKASLICSDISGKMIDFGREQYKDNDRVSFLELDIESPDLPKNMMGQFNHVTSFYCLHWCQNIQQVFENIFNLLTPGGTTLFTLISHCPALNAYVKLSSLPHYQPYMKDADRFVPVFHRIDRPRETLTALLEDVGFEIQHCSLREKTFIFNNPGELSDFMLAVNPFTDRMPTDLKYKFGNDLAREVEKENIIFNKSDNEEDYSVLFLYSTFLAYLRKPMTN